MIAVTNAEIWTITDGVIENGTVLMEAGVIKALGAAVEIPGDAQVFDVAGKIVLPG